MKHLFTLLQGGGILALFAAAGASDAGLLGLGALSAWVATASLCVLAGIVGGHIQAKRRARRPAPAIPDSPGERGGEVIPFPPIDAA